jgi:hypothetical protein
MLLGLWVVWLPMFPYLASLSHWVGAGTAVLPVIGWPLISAVVNGLLRKKSAQEWEMWALQKPGLALGVELGRAMGVEPSKIIVAFQRYAARRAGETPKDVIATSTLPPGIRTMLENPALMVALEAEAQRLLNQASSLARPLGV